MFSRNTHSTKATLAFFPGTPNKPLPMGLSNQTNVSSQGSPLVMVASQRGAVLQLWVKSHIWEIVASLLLLKYNLVPLTPTHQLQSETLYLTS